MLLLSWIYPKYTNFSVKTPKLTIEVQAYDNVWRPALFAKLEKIVFGGKTVALLKSMYKNDSVRFCINGKYSDELWLTRGVKQGKNKKN